MVRKPLGFTDEEYQEYIESMSDVWAEDIKLYGSGDVNEALDASEAGC